MESQWWVSQETLSNCHKALSATYYCMAHWNLLHSNMTASPLLHQSTISRFLQNCVTSATPQYSPWNPLLPRLVLPYALFTIHLITVVLFFSCWDFSASAAVCMVICLLYQLEITVLLLLSLLALHSMLGCSPCFPSKGYYIHKRCIEQGNFPFRTRREQPLFCCVVLLESWVLEQKKTQQRANADVGKWGVVLGISQGLENGTKTFVLFMA